MTGNSSSDSLDQITTSLERMRSFLSSAEGLDRGLTLDLTSLNKGGGGMSSSMYETPALKQQQHHSHFSSQPTDDFTSSTAKPPLGNRAVNSQATGLPSTSSNLAHNRRGFSSSPSSSSVFDRLARSPTFSSQITPYRSLQAQLSSASYTSSSTNPGGAAATTTATAATSATVTANNSTHHSPATIHSNYSSVPPNANSSSMKIQVKTKDHWDGPSATSLKLEQFLADAGKSVAAPTSATAVGVQNASSSKPQRGQGRGGGNGGGGIFAKLYGHAQRKQQREKEQAASVAADQAARGEGEQASQYPQTRVITKKGLIVTNTNTKSATAAGGKKTATTGPSPAASKPEVPHGSVWDRLTGPGASTGGGPSGAGGGGGRKEKHGGMSVASMTATNKAHQKSSNPAPQKTKPLQQGSSSPAVAEKPTGGPVHQNGSHRNEAALVDRLLGYAEMKKQRMEAKRDQEAKKEKEKILAHQEQLRKHTREAAKKGSFRQPPAGSHIYQSTASRQQQQNHHQEVTPAAPVEVKVNRGNKPPPQKRKNSRVRVPPHDIALTEEEEDEEPHHYGSRNENHQPELSKEAYALLLAEQRKAEEEEAERQREEKQRREEEEERERKSLLQEQKEQLLARNDSLGGYQITEEEDLRGVDNRYSVVLGPDGTWIRKSKELDDAIKAGDNNEASPPASSVPATTEEEPAKEQRKKTAYELHLEMNAQLQAQYAAKKKKETHSSENQNVVGSDDGADDHTGAPPAIIGTDSDLDEASDSEAEYGGPPGGQGEEERLGTGRPEDVAAREELKKMDEEEATDSEGGDHEDGESECAEGEGELYDDDEPGELSEEEPAKPAFIHPKVPPLKLRALQKGWNPRR